MSTDRTESARQSYDIRAAQRFIEARQEEFQNFLRQEKRRELSHRLGDRNHQQEEDTASRLHLGGNDRRMERSDQQGPGPYQIPDPHAARHPPRQHEAYRVPEPNHHHAFNEALPPPPPPPPPHAGEFAAYGVLQTPLTEDIVRTPLPDKYKSPQLTYDGLTNPKDFLGRFQYISVNAGLNQAHMCKTFPELLIGNARDWFDSLPPGSIGSYNDLMAAFHRNFFQKAGLKATPAHLLTIVQGREEKIGDFVTRFHQECLKIAGLNDQLVISAFEHCINAGVLHRQLIGQNPKTVREMWDIVDPFVRADEADRRKRALAHPGQSDRGKKDRSETPKPSNSAFNRLSKAPAQSRLGPRQDPEKQHQQTVPLTKSRAEIVCGNEFGAHNDASGEVRLKVANLLVVNFFLLGHDAGHRVDRKELCKSHGNSIQQNFQKDASCTEILAKGSY